MLVFLLLLSPRYIALLRVGDAINIAAFYFNYLFEMSSVRRKWQGFTKDWMQNKTGPRKLQRNNEETEKQYLIYLVSSDAQYDL